MVGMWEGLDGEGGQGVMDRCCLLYEEMPITLDV